jgi:hypothetical protein
MLKYEGKAAIVGAEIRLLDVRHVGVATWKLGPYVSEGLKKVVKNVAQYNR